MSNHNKNPDFTKPHENEGPATVTFVSGERFEVFTIKKHTGAVSSWSRAGSAFVNKDGSINVYLDALPLDGKLHIRRPAIRGEAADPKRSESSN